MGAASPLGRLKKLARLEADAARDLVETLAVVEVLRRMDAMARG